MPKKPVIYSEKIDYLTTQFPNHSQGSELFKGLVSNSNSADLSGFLGGSFFALLQTDRDGMKVVSITDNHGHPVVSLSQKTRNVQGVDILDRSIDFYGWFWTSYDSLFPLFCDYFSIEIDKPKMVKRIDYAIDILGVPVKRFRDSAISDTTVVKEHYGRAQGLEKHGQPTWYRFTNSAKRTTCELVAYDKKLDILDKGKHRHTDNHGNRPFSDYLALPDELDVTRLEYRLRSHGIRELSDSSVAGILQSIKARSWKFIKTYFKAIPAPDIPKIVRTPKPYVIQRDRNLANAKKNASGVVSRFLTEWGPLELIDALKTEDLRALVPHLRNHPDLFVAMQSGWDTFDTSDKPEYTIPDPTAEKG